MVESSPLQKNSLFNAMNRFIGAVNNMDQTVMLPSMLRDLPVDEDSELGALNSDMDEGDLYSYYQQLKSIRRDIEWGVRCAAAEESHKERMTVTRTSSSASNSSAASDSSSNMSFSSEDEDEEDEDLEKQFQYHLTGLQGVLSKLTVQADCLTKRYKQELGIGGWGQ